MELPTWVKRIGAGLLAGLRERGISRIPDLVSAFATSLLASWRLVLPLACLDLGVLLAAVLMSHLLRKPLYTPLLHLSQTLFHLLFLS